MRLKHSKCTFLACEVEYQGYRINKVCLEPTSDKIKVIKEAPAPKIGSELNPF